jgi:hypothetical protein
VVKELFDIFPQGAYLFTRLSITPSLFIKKQLFLFSASNVFGIVNAESEKANKSELI